MHAPFDRSRKSDHDTAPKKAGGFLIFPVLIAIALLALALAQPKSSIWISQAVQAEFGGGGIADDMPTETVQEPGMTIPMRTVHAQ
jgi:UDP-N-acetylmuramyl pentapeptide phosphotransferase/UDP-N-acetylglucosamine-1-phosphate transferase